MSISTLILNTLCIGAFLLTSACSSISSKIDIKNNSENKVLTKNSVNGNKVNDKGLKHAHAPNPCTVALEHSHLYSDIDHQHKYDCESTNDFVSNAHVHEATDLNKRFRHVHPNGANKHSHFRKSKL